MPDSPAETIRAYLERNGREAHVPFHNLLTTWQIERAGEAERERIEQELEQAGLKVEPALTGLAPSDEVLLRVAPAPEDEPHTPTSVPHWDAQPEAAIVDDSPSPLGRSPWLRRVKAYRHDLIGFVLVLLSGGLAVAVGYVLGKGL
jgi:hypothetical protein